MTKELAALADIILYLNASEPKGLYCENIETIQQALLELQSIKEANPSEALEYIENKLKDLEYVAKKNDNEYLLSKYIPSEKFATIKNSLLKAEKYEKIILGIEDYLNRRIEVEPLEDVRKAFIEIRNQLQVIKEVIE